MVITAGFIATADVPASVTIVLAFLTGGFGVIGGVLTARKQADATVQAAEEQRRASVLVAQGNRRAAWQMHKREIYAEFLGSARAVIAAPDSAEAHANYQTQADRVRLVGSEGLSSQLSPFIADPTQLSDAARWNEVVEYLADDAGQD